MPYTYILDESDSDSDSWSLDSPISPKFFLKNKELPFSSMGELLYDHRHIFAWPFPF